MRPLLLALLFAALGGRAVAAQTPDSTLLSAERAAREWITWLDAEELEQAWLAVAPAMRASIAFEDWATSLRTLRSILPAAAPRTLLRAAHGVPLFGGPSVWLTFHVGDRPWREIVVLVRAGSRWRVAGYGVLL